MIVRPCRAALLLVVAAALGAHPAAAQQAAALDTSFVRHVAQMARQRATQLAVAPAQPENPRAVQQYREALADLDRGAWRDGLTTMLAVLQRAPQNPLYRGDLAYAYLRTGQFDQSATEYTRASQSQPQNGWFELGVAMTFAAQNRFADAAGHADIALQADSGVADSAVASTAAGWFEAAGDRTRALAWTRIAVQKAPSDATAWLRIALYLIQARGDTTTEGFAAIRRNLSLSPGNKLGAIVYAHYLLIAGQNDSALVYAASAAQDSTYRAVAAQEFLAAGRAFLVRRDVDRALEVLDRGQGWADSTLRVSFSYYTGRGQLQKIASALNSYEERHTCDLAHAADSLTAAAERNLRAWLSVDSTRTQQLLDQVLPQYKANAQSALRSCQNAGEAAPQRGRPRPAPRPTQPARPARPRP